jgi:hypothetical protein
VGRFVSNQTDFLRVWSSIHSCLSSLAYGIFFGCLHVRSSIYSYLRHLFTEISRTVSVFASIHSTSLQFPSLHLRRYNLRHCIGCSDLPPVWLSIKRLSNSSLLSSLPLPLHQRLPVLYPLLRWTTTTISVQTKHHYQQLMYVSSPSVTSRTRLISRP